MIDAFTEDIQDRFGVLPLRIPRGASMSSHLCSFALRTALPSSLVGRCSHDYYEHSVTLGLAARGLIPRSSLSYVRA